MIRRIRTAAAGLAVCLLLVGCGNDTFSTSSDRGKRMELSYAKQFSVSVTSGGAAKIDIADEQHLIYEPEGVTAPQEQKEGRTVISGPLRDIYVASSSDMDLFLQTGALENVSMTSTKQKDWTIPEVRDAMKNGKLSYIGKYSMPDFERLATSGCPLAVENTMIFHTPAVKEQIEQLEIPVLVDYSSYEAHPLGRLEWIRLYGLLTGHEKEAEAFFEKQAERYEEIKNGEPTGKTVAFFYITDSGSINIRKPGDYITTMIEDAGGSYAFDGAAEEEENALSTMNLEAEAFYEMGKDADIIIYNSTVDGVLDSVDGLVARCGLLMDFKAVRNRQVWCTEADLYQQTGRTVDFIEDVRAVLSGRETEKMTFLTRLK